ncbi:MAG: hypothetical protein ACLFN5_00510 [bacterium]
MSIPIFLILISIIGLVGVMVVIVAQSEEADHEEIEFEPLQLESEKSDPVPEKKNPLDTFFEKQLLSEDETEDVSGKSDYSDLSLPFEPLNTFEPDPNQHSELSRELNRYPWPKKEAKTSAEYDDRSGLDFSSKSIHKAIEWLLAANTEAIHQRHQYEKYLSFLLPFVKTPRAGGAEAIQATPWRDRAANMSRLTGERLLVIALGLSCHGPVEMDCHLESFSNLLTDTWNKDGLEQPLLYQCVGRLGILTPTDVTELQAVLKKRISGLVYRDEPSKLEKARLNSFLLAISAGQQYPFPTAEGQLSRLWHWDENSPPLAEWEYLLPVLYSLWIHHWLQDRNAGAVRDLAALLGSWWDNNKPPAGFFVERPEVWEGILMTAWALVPKNNLVWNKLRERYAELENFDAQLREITEGYFGWHENFVESGEIPPESFTGRRVPPARWMYPLPSDILSEASQPSFEFPVSWLNALSEIKVPNFENLEKYRI